MNSRNHAGISLVEILVVLVLVIVLISLMRPSIGNGLSKGGMTQTLSNMKQLHLATQQMALDGVTTGDTNLGWPGDTGGTFYNWMTPLLGGGYLTTNDVYKLLSAPGIIVGPKTPLTATNTALLIYAVSTNLPGSAVFLSTANFTNNSTGGIFNPSAKPYGKKGFAVFRQGGDGAILQPRHAGQTNVIGSFAPLCR